MLTWALDIATENVRPDAVDVNLAHQDVEEIVKIMDGGSYIQGCDDIVPFNRGGGFQ